MEMQTYLVLAQIVNESEDCHAFSIVCRCVYSRRST